MSGQLNKNVNGSLTSLLLRRPANLKKIKTFGRSHKLQSDELIKLKTTYDEMERANDLDGLTVFHIACSLSHPDIVEHLVKEEGWEVNYKCDKVGSPLRNALCNGNLPTARKLIELGADYKSFDGHGSTPMTAALNIKKREKSCVNAVKLLLNAGVSANDTITEDLQAKALHLAITNNFPAVVSCLLQNGADINIQDCNGFTPLHVGVIQKRFEIIKLLLLHSPDFYKVLLTGETPFIMALNENLRPVMELFVRHGYNLNVPNTTLEAAPLHTAVRLLDKDMVTYLIGLGANVNLPVNDGLAPIHCALNKCLVLEEDNFEKSRTQERKDMIELLVENGADVNIKTHYRPPLPYAIGVGSFGLAKLLLKLGADPNCKYSIFSGLFLDVLHSNRDIIINFLEHGADYNHRNEKGITPYHYAIFKRIDLEYVKCFVKHGCPYNQDKQIFTEFLKMANYGTEFFLQAEIKYFKGIKENDLNAVKQAVDSGAVVGGCSEEMKHPLHFVALHGYNEMLTYLLEKQASPNVLNGEGETALHVAAKQGHYNICRTLLRFGAVFNLPSKKCQRTPKAMAEQENHKDVIKLLDAVGRMFFLVSKDDNRVVKVLNKKLVSDLNEYMVFAKATNKRGDSLLATAIRKNNMDNAKGIMSLQIGINLPYEFKSDS